MYKNKINTNEIICTIIEETKRKKRGRNNNNQLYNMVSLVSTCGCVCK